MNVYIYQAALLCEECGESQRDLLAKSAIDNGILDMPTPETPEHEYDSDRYPKGPFPDGGGESDSPAHCDYCETFLENPLTEEGLEYVREAIEDHRNNNRGRAEIIEEWESFYDLG